MSPLTFAALALVSFAVALAASGLYDWITTRQRRGLILMAVGGLSLLAFFFLASRFAVPLFGRTPLAFDLPVFVAGELPFLALVTGGIALAIGILLLARRRPALAWACLSLLLLGGFTGPIWFSAQAVHSEAASPSSPTSPHPPLEGVRAPQGFKVQVFASDLQEPNALAFDDQGNLYYTELVDGNVVRLTDTNHDGKADASKVFASGFKNPRGLAYHDGRLYVSSRGQINSLQDTDGDGAADENDLILEGLFSLDIQHSNNGIAFGPDGRLYIANGGPRVYQLEQNGTTYSYQGQPREGWMFGGILVADADGKNLQMLARGLRNPYSLSFGADGTLYATDNGDDTIPEPRGDELNLIEAGGDYGYPYFFGIPPPWSDTRMPLIEFIPHSAPTGVIVYEADLFPAEYQQSVLVALYWHGLPKSPWREVIRASPTVLKGKTVWQTHAFIENLDHPVALATGSDGAVYIADLRGGKADPEFPGAIYRVSYQK